MAKTTAKKNELTTTEKTLAEIQEVADKTSIAKLQNMPQMQRAITLSQGMKRLRQLIAGPILDDMYELMDTNLGFRTDRAPGTKDKDGNFVKPYSKEVARDCLIEGLLRGANPIGNEINIISSKCYLTKEHYERKVNETVDNLRVYPGVPVSGKSGALVSMRAEWIYQGQKDRIDCVLGENEDLRIPVRVNAGMGVDAILGKAFRKLYAKIYKQATGTTILDEADDPDTITVQPSSNQGMPQEEAAAAEAAESSDAAAPQENAAADPEPQQQTSKSIFAGIQKLLEGMQTVEEVNKYEEQAMTVLKTDEEQAKLSEWCSWRRAHISTDE